MRCDGALFDKIVDFSTPCCQAVSGSLVCLTLKVKALIFVRNVGNYMQLHKE